MQATDLQSYASVNTKFVCLIGSEAFPIMFYITIIFGNGPYSRIRTGKKIKTRRPNFVDQTAKFDRTPNIEEL